MWNARREEIRRFPSKKSHANRIALPEKQANPSGTASTDLEKKPPGSAAAHRPKCDGNVANWHKSSQNSGSSILAQLIDALNRASRA
jgi:hypothetical protein